MAHWNLFVLHHQYANNTTLKKINKLTTKAVIVPLYFLFNRSILWLRDYNWWNAFYNVVQLVYYSAAADMSLRLIQTLSPESILPS